MKLSDQPVHCHDTRRHEPTYDAIRASVSEVDEGGTKKLSPFFLGGSGYRALRSSRNDCVLDAKENFSDMF